MRRKTSRKPSPEPPFDWTRAVFLVSCVSKKASTRAPAKDLYLSPWFVKARRYVESTGRPWYVLSAEYGLVHPYEVIEPYDKTLNKVSAGERRLWAAWILGQARARMPNASCIIIFGGKHYREYLVDKLKSVYGAVLAPLAKYRIGEQLQWLDRHAAAMSEARRRRARLRRR
jgi:hypothetical protein